MRSFLSALPNADLPDVAAEADLSPVPVLPADDDDLIRPADEDELLRVHSRALTDARPTALAKYLIWTFGPDHLALPFPIQLRTEIEDDAVISCDTEIGWSHRGLEKQLETLPYLTGIDVMARFNPGAPVAPRLAWVLAVERLIGIHDEVPMRAQLWRTIAAELERAHAHLQVVIVGLRTGRRARRTLVAARSRLGTLLEMCAYRDGKFLAVPGGVVDDPGPQLVDTLRTGLASALAPFHRVLEAERASGAFTRDLVGKGRISRPAAFDLSVSGPALRAIGFADDVRLSDPYFCYASHPPRIATAEGGGIAARLKVRLEEIAISAALVLRLLSELDDVRGGPRMEGPLPIDDDGHLLPPAGSAQVSVEAPSGELSVHLVSDGSARPLRARLVSPSFKLASALGDLLTDARLDEVVPILSSLGMSGAEIDR